MVHLKSKHSYTDFIYQLIMDVFGVVCHGMLSFEHLTIIKVTVAIQMVGKDAARHVRLLLQRM